ncbi:GyrI-like domain-containing protein [Solitalea lacus]|uniref:GyrI-like domain-containing protein n=1 Tax=Solitalea lacus TaxID=2911172 RepID=UPI001EDB58BD|nr:GyrI-like domain-containing protein [Solitalea lacus]UKJ06207.1 GyrI-like domain-containing protein [Solitalea lacus]
MQQPPRIETLKPKKLIGKRLTMCLAENRTFELWSSFMPLRKTIQNQLGSNLYSMQVYEPGLDFNLFDLQTTFEKWAAVEVSDFNSVPASMETYELQGGLYAVFIHKGPPSAFQATFQYIFKEWLPNSGYMVDTREHFELLGDKYRNNQPDSEEEVWVPIRR